jgi:alcohol dehydrogenase
MKALVYHGPGKKTLEDRPMPQIAAPTDAIVKIVKTTICGTDLHILKGDVPTCAPGRILGHEGIGVVEKVGAAVTGFRIGDRVIVSCVSSCGKCDYCRRGMYSHCVNGGWILGNKIDGTQAEFVCIPFADTSLYHIPAGADEDALVMLSDILPTGFECGVLNGKVQPGSTIAIVGAGPIGLATLLTAHFYSPAEIIMVDLDDNRLQMSSRFGATTIINNKDGKAVEKDHGDDRRPRRRYSHRSGRHARELHHLPGYRGARRHHRQYRRARGQGGSASGATLGSQHRDYDQAR